MLGITDGEFRRTFFHVDFLEQLDGVVTKGAVTVRFHNRAGDVDFAPPVMSVTGKVRARAADPARRLRVPRERDDARRRRRCRSRRRRWCTSAAGAPRSTSTPTRISTRSSTTSPRAYRAEIALAVRRRLPVPPARRHQPRLPVRSGDARGRARARRRSRRAAARATPASSTRAIADKPAEPDGLRSTCAVATSGARGSPRAATSRSPRCCSTSWRSTATSWSTTTSARATSRRCASCRRTRRSCSAWSPPSSAELESPDELARRIDEAAQYVPLDQLRSRPQCGFSSTVHGNDITPEEQSAKLRLVVETAMRVWGTL